MINWNQNNSSRRSTQGLRSMQIVEVKAVTWNKDSHGLFDYENSYYDMKKFIIGDNATLARLNNEITCIPDNEEVDPANRDSLEPLLTIAKNARSEGKYYLDIQTPKFTNKDSIYLIVRSLKCKDGRTQRGYSLSPGDTIKLGRVEYRVTEMQVGNDPSSCRIAECGTQIPTDTLFDANNQARPSTDNDHVCKYCLMDKVNDIDLDNLMLYPCKCSGSSAGVHFGCLRNWVQYKIIAKQGNNVSNYHWKKLECEICLEPLPRRIQFGSGIFELINIEKPQTPHIILEKMSDDHKSSSFVLIVPEVGQVIKMGRGHQCDFRISDISVSRIHAHLKFEDGKFFVYDNDSKFGTLVLLSENYNVKDDKAAVQIGRTVFTFVQKKLAGESLQALSN